MNIRNINVPRSSENSIFTLQHPQEYINAIKGKSIEPDFRIYILNPDETIYKEISDDLIYGLGSLTINYQQGQRRSLNFALDNSSKEYTPNPNNRKIWIGTKIRLDLGIKLKDGTIYYKQNGIFVVSDPVVTRHNAEEIVTIQCYDKFALLDGTLGGTIDATWEISAGKNIRDAIQEILLLNDGTGNPYDSKLMFFDPQYLTTQTAYTVEKAPGSSWGEMIIELADMIACDVYYNEFGNLVISSGQSGPYLYQYK